MQHHRPTLDLASTGQRSVRGTLVLDRLAAIGTGIAPMTPIFAVLLIATSVTLVGCGGSGGGADNPLDQPLGDPTSNESFFNGSLRDIRNGGDAALSGFNAGTYLNRVAAQIPEGFFEGLGSDEQRTVKCRGQGQMTIGSLFEGEFKAYKATTTLELDDCQQDQSTFDGELTIIVERSATNAADLIKTTRDFDLSLSGEVASSGSAILKGSFVEEVQTEFNSPEGCTPAVTDSTTYQLQDGSRLLNGNGEVTAAYETLDYQLRERTRFFDTDTTCRAETYTQFTGNARGKFSRVADATVLIEKKGVYSAGGRLDSDEPAQLSITAPGTQNKFQVSAIGDGPDAVQIDITDNNAVRSENDTWDFGS